MGLNWVGNVLENYWFLDSFGANLVLGERAGNRSYVWERRRNLSKFSNGWSSCVLCENLRENSWVWEEGVGWERRKCEKVKMFAIC